jgi:hypothetical protein
MYGNGYASTIKVRGETKSEREREIQNSRIVVQNHLQRSRSKQAYAKREYPLKPQAEHQVVRPNLE